MVLVLCMFFFIKVVIMVSFIYNKVNVEIGKTNMNKILIIDDDKELCELIKQSVLQESIEADCCYSGKSGLLQLREKEYQLAILDVMMPGFDGFETLEQIERASCRERV